MARWKEFLELIKPAVEIAGFLAAILYFGYRLLAGVYILSRLEMELVSDTPFVDKCLVRSALKLKNVGEATLRVMDARLSVFALDVQGQPNAWSVNDKRPKEPLPFVRRSLEQLDFQRVSIPSGKESLGNQQAEKSREWLNIDPGGTQRREFIQRLQPGLYKLEFRLIASPMFGRRYTFLSLILALPWASVSKAGQWVATSVVDVPYPQQGTIGIM